jgi:hypothetical protein
MKAGLAVEREGSGDVRLGLRARDLPATTIVMTTWALACVLRAEA